MMVREMGLRRQIKNALRLAGVDYRSWSNYRHLPRYIRHRSEWLKQGGSITKPAMVLSNYQSNAGSASGHYFHQDLLVAGFIHERKPVRHVDVGSRIDGFVAHVASFRPIEIFDILPLPLKAHPSIIFTRADLMKDAGEEVTDSLSCLHTLEHFGLGRYSDPIDVNGHIKGVANLVRMVKPGGVFYLSVPISDRDEVRFNSERVFHPESVLNFEPIKSHMLLQRFDYVDDADGGLITNADVKSAVEKRVKGCGIYTFVKAA